MPIPNVDPYNPPAPPRGTSNPVTVYKGKEVRENVQIVEVQAWLDDGWSTSPPDAAAPEPVNQSVIAVPKINLNTCTEEELIQAGLKIAQAKQIIERRPIKTMDDLKDIKANWSSSTVVFEL